MSSKNELEYIQKQLTIMRDVVSQCQKLVIEDGTLYILWGSLAVIASLLTYVLVWLKTPGWTFIVLWAVIFYGPGVLATYRNVKGRKKHVITFGERLIGRLWFGVIVVSASAMLVNVLQIIPWQIIVVIPFSFGLVYFPLALLMDWKPLSLFALAWIAGGVVMLFVPFVYSFLVLDVLIIVCEIIPGILIKKRAHKQIDVTQAE